MNWLVYFDNSELLHLVKEQLFRGESAVKPCIKDPLSQRLVACRLQLSEFSWFWHSGLVNIIIPLNLLKLPLGFCHLQGECWPRQLLQPGGLAALGCCGSMNRLCVLGQNIHHELPGRAPSRSGEITIWNRAMQGWWHRHCGLKSVGMCLLTFH